MFHTIFFFKSKPNQIAWNDLTNITFNRHREATKATS